MHSKNIIRSLAVSVLLALAAVSALAQTGRIEGDVKNDKGEPIVGAEVEIVRTDIKGSYPVKTDKKGHYLHAGVPYVGTYTILFSAPGYSPAHMAGIRPDKPLEVVSLGAGDGHKLTIDQIGKSAAAGKGGAPGAATPKMSEAERKKAEEENNRRKAENEKQTVQFDDMKKRFAAGNEMLGKNDYNGAVTEYREAAKLDPEQYVIFGNLAVALYNRGVGFINGGQKDAAKQDFTDSAAAADQAITLLKTKMADPAKGNDPGMKKQNAAYLKSKADANGILGTKFGDAAAADNAAAIYKDAAAASDDPAAKKTLMLKRANMLREAYKNDDAIAAYKEILQAEPDNIEALYWLGITYSSNEKTWQDSANTLQAFVDKAPDSDSRKADAKSVIGELLKGNNIQPPKSSGSTSKTRKKP